MAASSDRKPTPNFFDDDELNPITAATQAPAKTKHRPAKAKKKPSSGTEAQKHRTVEKKKKVGYYFKPTNIERLEKIFLEIQLKKQWKGKISVFVETIIEYGLDDLESEASKIMKRLEATKST